MIRYKIIENKGLVKAFLHDTELDAYYRVTREYNKILRGENFKMLRKSYSAQAKVNPECDEFDENVGKKIAKDRLLVKYYSDRIASEIEIAEFYEQYVEKLMEIIRKDFNKRADYVRELGELGAEV